MTRSWKLLGLPLILAGTLGVAPAGWAQGEPNRDDVIARDLRELRGAVDALTKVVKEFQSAWLNADLEIQKSKADIAQLRQSIALLRQDVDGMNQRLANERRSFYPATPPATGRLRLVNTFAQPVTIVVNARAYTLTPGQTQVIEAMPTGPFTYEVLGIQAALSRTLEPNETFTITVHPR